MAQRLSPRDLVQKLYQPSSLVMFADNSAMYVACPAGIMKLDFGGPYVKFANYNSDSFITIVAGRRWHGGIAPWSPGIFSAMRTGLPLYETRSWWSPEGCQGHQARQSGEVVEAPVWKLVDSCVTTPAIGHAGRKCAARSVGALKGSYFQKHSNTSH